MRRIALLVKKMSMDVFYSANIFSEYSILLFKIRQKIIIQTNFHNSLF